MLICLAASIHGVAKSQMAITEVSDPTFKNAAFIGDTSTTRWYKGCYIWIDDRIDILFDFDNHGSWVFGKRTDMFAIRFGLQVKERYRFGMGFYKTSKEISLKPLETAEDTIGMFVKFSYTSWFFEYVFYKDYKWEFSIPLGLGKGKADLRKTSAKFDTNEMVVVDKIPIASISIEAHYRFLRFLGIGVGAGYRAVLGDNESLKAFSAPMYILKLDIYIGELYKYFFRREDSDAERTRYLHEREIKHTDHD